jgi:D-proline reductase (dithiol) PrdB
MIVDSFRFLPRSFVPLFDSVTPMPGEEDEVWSPFPGRLADSRIALLTSAGLYLDGEQAPFDLDRERREPTWGDPSLRVLPDSLDGRALRMNHLHVNATDVLADPEIALPLAGLAGLAAEGRVGSVAASHYSVMGYQEAGLRVWRSETAPAIAGRLRDERVDGLILAPV